MDTVEQAATAGHEHLAAISKHLHGIQQEMGGLAEDWVNQPGLQTVWGDAAVWMTEAIVSWEETLAKHYIAPDEHAAGQMILMMRLMAKAVGALNGQAPHARLIGRLDQLEAQFATINEMERALGDVA
jgi:hypothetical protein